MSLLNEKLHLMLDKRGFWTSQGTLSSAKLSAVRKVKEKMVSVDLSQVSLFGFFRLRGW
jgi:hypothetical protein